jgi:hypothetical protein
MMNSEALRILATMTTVTADTIAERDIEVALMCYEPAIEDLNLRVALIDACDVLRDDNRDDPYTSTCLDSAARVINAMIAAR